jgi:hypothetical protein
MKKILIFDAYPSIRRLLAEEPAAEGYTTMSLGKAESLMDKEGMPREGRFFRLQAEKIRRYILGNQAAWIAAIGLKTGLFRARSSGSEGGMSEEDLSANTGFKPASSCWEKKCARDKGASPAVFGTGAVGRAAVMAGGIFRRKGGGGDP